MFPAKCEANCAGRTSGNCPLIQQANHDEKNDLYGTGGKWTPESWRRYRRQMKKLALSMSCFKIKELRIRFNQIAAQKSRRTP